MNFADDSVACHTAGQFGREREVNQAIRLLEERPLLAVVGPSGAGKSSFVRAGLIPALKQSGEGWEAYIVRPGSRPLGALADLLRQLTDEDITTGHISARTTAAHPGARPPDSDDDRDSDDEADLSSADTAVRESDASISGVVSTMRVGTPAARRVPAR